MYLFMLMVVPIIIGIVGMFWSKGKVSWQEFLAMEGAVFLVVLAGWGISRMGATSDVEIWNGRVVAKYSQHVSCSHSHTTCTGSGKNQVCVTWYEHAYDVSWYVKSSSTDVFEIDRVDRQGVTEPPRFTAAYRGEPTASTHSYTNYIKANPDSVLRRIGTVGKFPIPPQYPASVYNYYYVDRFVQTGLADPNTKDWVWLLQQANADLGPKKQANVVVVLTRFTDPTYEYALEEKWLGGKKNDIIVLIGTPQYPRISWVRVLAWSKSDDVKIHIRDDVQGLVDIRRRDQIVAAIKSDVDTYFVRRPMSDFKYLMAGYQPGTGGTLLLFFLGTLICVGMTWYFYENDPFGTDYDHRAYKRLY